MSSKVYSNEQIILRNWNISKYWQRRNFQWTANKFYFQEKIVYIYSSISSLRKRFKISKLETAAE